MVGAEGISVNGKFTRFPADEQHKPSVLDYAISDIDFNVTPYIHIRPLFY